MHCIAIIAGIMLHIANIAVSCIELQQKCGMHSDVRFQSCVKCVFICGYCLLSCVAMVHIRSCLGIDLELCGLIWIANDCEFVL